jgi:hypothetical protein
VFDFFSGFCDRIEMLSLPSKYAAAALSVCSLGALFMNNSRKLAPGRLSNRLRCGARGVRQDISVRHADVQLQHGRPRRDIHWLRHRHLRQQAPARWQASRTCRGSLPCYGSSSARLGRSGLTFRTRTPPTQVTRSHRKQHVAPKTTGAPTSARAVCGLSPLSEGTAASNACTPSAATGDIWMFITRKRTLLGWRRKWKASTARVPPAPLAECRQYAAATAEDRPPRASALG